MKIPSLLSQYLREHKTLSLPGIGVFQLAGPFPADDESSAMLSEINFESKRVSEPDGSLIDFIKKETGKIKPLALADLDCYLESGMQLLNIGKPFYLEGIGSIQKKKDGKYEFTPGEAISTKLEPINKEQEKKTSVFEESKYEPKANPMQKILAVGLLLTGLAIVLIGGYYLYNRNNNTHALDEESLNTAPVIQPKIDSVVTKVDSVQVPKLPDTHKFVLENTNKARALKRYRQLVELLTNIQMETTDSINFKLFFVIPSKASDTLRIKDSLANYYGKRVVIE